MASSRITPRQWEELKPKIQDLVHRGCPLKCKDGSRQTISEILQQDLNISITVAQLEPKLRKWGVAKNLKLHEWREIMPRLDEFEASGTSYRILLANHKIPQSAVQGARKRLGSENLTAEQRSQETLHNSQTRTISIVDSSGQVLWSSIAESPQQPHTNVDLGQDDGIDAVLEDATMSENLTTSKQGFPADFLLQTALSCEPESTENQVVLRSPLRHEDTQPFLQETPGTSGWDFTFGPCVYRMPSGALTPQLTFQEILPNHINLPGVTELDDGPLESWCSPTTSALQNSVQQPHQSLILRSGQTDLTLLPSRALEAAQVFLRRMLRHAVTSHDDTTSPAVTAQEDPAQQPQDPSSEQVDELLDRLLSLLPHKDVEAIQNDASVKDDPGSLVRKLLLCSVINNFAGLKDIPHSAVLGMLKTDPHMRSELFGHLQVSSPALAKTVANTLFRAALETCDVEAAEAIIEASKEKPYAIVPDSMVYECKLERGRNHDSHQACAMEMAVCSGSLRMVHTLLRLNVDVNKTQRSSVRDYQNGPLWLAICESPLVNMELVEVLLDHGAKVGYQHVLYAMKLHVPRLLEILLQQMPSHEHKRLLFKRNSFNSNERTEFLRNLAACHRNSDATTVIRLFLDKCDESGCNCDCSDSLVQAAKRGNIDFFELLRDRRKLVITGGVFSAAIRSRKQSLIEFLLREIEGREDGPLLSYINAETIDYLLDRLCATCATTPPAKDQYYSRIQLLTTPLAEAIRAQDDELIQVLENLGAYVPILESSPTGADHVEAATCAAAEVGSLVFLRRLLADATSRSIKALCPALCTAIRWGKAEAVSIILSWLFRVAVSGVDRFGDWDSRTPDPLIEALRAKEEQLVYTLLDLGIFTADDVRYKESYLELASLWKSDSLIRDMLLMGFRCSKGYRTTPLIEAVRSKNKALVELLLAHGADINRAPDKSRISPLGQAVLVADQEMTQLLHFNGAKMTSEEFSQAFSSRGPVHDLLFTFFYSSVHSDPELGPIALKKALELGDLGMLKKLLSTGMNPNIFIEISWKEKITPLGFAVRHSVDHSLIRTLYDHGADVNLWAMRHGEKSWTALLLAIEQRNLAMINLLLDLGADVHLPAKLFLKRTPLQAACEIGSTAIVRLFLERGADVNAPPARVGGGSVLRLAAQGGFVGIAELLLSHGAKLIQDQRLEDMTALEAAAYKGRIHMLQLLWEAGKGGFSVDEIDRAIAHAKKRGHQTCADWLGILRSMHVSAAKGLQEASHDRA
ncbi:hypothetical protein MCOR12_010620 [Pyricularia oryzae]|nr:hypothetical protein MCOR12_010620 [Pyricularia oryzae]